MPLYDNPPHRVTHYTSASGRDDGGGTTLTFTLAQSAVAVSINTTSSSERELFAQLGMIVTHRVAALLSKFTTAPKRGDKLVADDNGATYHVLGISAGRSYGNIPAFVYLECQEQL